MKALVLVALLAGGERCPEPGTRSSCPERQVCVRDGAPRGGVCVNGCWKDADCAEGERCVRNPTPPGSCYRSADSRRGAL